MSIQISQFGRLAKTLKRLRDKYKTPVKMQVGYSAPYAIYVHENMEMVLEGEPRPSGIGVYWGRPNRPGQSKFLEQPARELADELGRTIGKALQSGTTMKQAFALAGNRLMNVSKGLVPVEYGDLKDSAFVRVE